MTKQENMAGTELVVDSIRILKQNGLTGAGAVTYERKINELEQKVTVVSQNQERYTDISDDKTITSEEKQTLKKEVLVITTEYPIFVSSAESAKVKDTTTFSNYTDAYVALTTYLNTTLHVFDDMTTSTSIPSRSNFNAYFQLYYKRQQELQELISKGFAETYSGLTEQNAIPVMVLSSTVIQVTSYTEESPEYNEYDPGYITFRGILKNGDEEQNYSTRFKVFRNGSDAPVYQSSRAEQSGSYTIPADTTSLRVVMYDQLGNIIYDNEPLDFITQEDGTTLHLANKYQTFYNGSAKTEGTYFKSTLVGYDGLESRPIDLGKFPTVEGLSFRADGNDILITPTAEIASSGEVTFSAYVELTDADDGVVYGIGSGSDAVIIGIPNGQYDSLVMGEFDGVTKDVTFEYTNIEHEELRENLQTDSGKYLGYYYDYTDLPKAKIGDYVLFVGNSVSGTIWKNGLTYKWNGVHWEIDNNQNHEMTSLTDALKVSQTLLDMDPNAIAVLLVKYLAVNQAFIKMLVADDAFINRVKTSSIELTGENASIFANYNEGENGFKLKSNGQAEFNEVTVRGVINSTSAYISGQSTFEGDIFSGPLILTSNESEGELLSSTFTYRTDRSRTPLLKLLETYGLIESQMTTKPYTVTSKKIEGVSPVSFSYMKISFTSFVSWGTEYYRNTIDFYNSGWVLVHSVSDSDVGVSFRPIMTGSKTFRLIDIPTSPSSVSGVVWCDTNNSNVLKLS